MPIAANICPRCGAPLKLNADRSCFFCQARLEVTTSEGRPDHVAIAAAVDASGPFSMQVEDVFSIRGRGTVVTGKVGAGQVRKGDRIRIVHAGKTIEARCTGVEMFRKVVDVAVAGQQVGLCLEGLEKDDVARGDWLRG